MFILIFVDVDVIDIFHILQIISRTEEPSLSAVTSARVSSISLAGRGSNYMHTHSVLKGTYLELPALHKLDEILFRKMDGSAISAFCA